MDFEKTLDHRKIVYIMDLMIKLLDNILLPADQGIGWRPPNATALMHGGTV